MGWLAERDCLQRMCELIAASEDRIVEAVSGTGLPPGGAPPTFSEAGREAVRGLSDAIFQAVYSQLEVAEDGPRRDPVVAFGIVRARAQEGTVVTPSEWSRLLRGYRQTYLELVQASDFRPDELVVCRRFIQWVFDRIEDGFARGSEAPRAEPGSPAA